MGKSLELLGLAGFNVFLALILAVTFLGGGKAEGVLLDSLTEEYVEAFLNDANAIASGKREDMDDFSITGFFMDHIADSGAFVNKVAYQLPLQDPQEKTVQMGKMDFIASVLQDIKSKEKEEGGESFMKIESIVIADNGRRARTATTSQDKGVMPMDDGSGEIQSVPVSGTSYCEQDLVLQDRRIKMEKTDCTTTLDFSSY